LRSARVLAQEDLTPLRAAYAQAGIPEYWIVDARREDLRFEILELLGDVYRATAPSDQPQLSRALGRSFALARSRNRAGRWSYSLSAAG
jgi:Uma2 family endonuclease